MIHQLHRSTIVNTSIETVWDFIATPRNLNRITPENLSFEILSDIPEVMFDGLVIEYRVKIPLFGRWRWLTEIKHIRQGRSFVDEQRVGPYKLWYHYHEVRPHSEGTEILDIVTYQMPFGLLGDLVNAIIVKRQLTDIFNFRERVFKQILKNIADQD